MTEEYVDLTETEMEELEYYPQQCSGYLDPEDNIPY